MTIYSEELEDTIYRNDLSDWPFDEADEYSRRKDDLYELEHPSEIMPSEYWDSLDKDQFLSWVQLIVEAVRQQLTLQELSSWQDSLSFDIPGYLEFCDNATHRYRERDDVELAEEELLELAAWALAKAQEKC